MKYDNKSLTGKKQHKKKGTTFEQWTAEQVKQVAETAKKETAKKGGKG